MFSNVLAFLILCLGMYLSRKIVDRILIRYHLFSNGDRFFNSKKNDSVSELIATIPPDFYLPNDSLFNANNSALDSVCTEAIENAESFTEEITLVVEALGEQFANTLEGW